jgi:hypothetical protein
MPVFFDDFFLLCNVFLALIRVGFVFVDFDRRVPHAVGFTGKSSTNIKDSHVHAEILFSHVKDLTGVVECHFVAQGISASRANVEGNTNHLEAIFLGCRQEWTPLGAGCSEFGEETTLTSTIVSNDAKDEFNFLADSGAL